jgi:hypothetical protein
MINEDLILENETNEQIASELGINVRKVQNYKQRIDKRYGDFQRSKTDNTLFLECQLFKNRMLTLYKSLETTVMSEKTSGTEKAKCAEVAANIAIDVLKMESEGIKAVRDLGLAASLANKNNSTSLNNNNNNNLRTDKNDNDSNDESFKECDPNRKF